MLMLHTCFIVVHVVLFLGNKLQIKLLTFVQESINVALLYIAASNLKDMCYVACLGTDEVQV